LFNDSDNHRCKAQQSTVVNFIACCPAPALARLYFPSPQSLVALVLRLPDFGVPRAFMKSGERKTKKLIARQKRKAMAR